MGSMHASKRKENAKSLTQYLISTMKWKKKENVKTTRLSLLISFLF